MRLGDAGECIKLIIKRVNVQNSNLKNYLFSLGLVKNTFIRVIKKSFFNGPMIISIRNYQLSISREIACDIEVDYV